MSEKIGSDVLGKKRLPPKKRLPEEMQRRLEEMEEERKRRLEELGIKEGEERKIRQLEEEGKLPKLPMPDEHPHGKKTGEGETWETIEEKRRKAKEKRKTVHVDEHYRRPPGEAEEDEYPLFSFTRVWK